MRRSLAVLSAVVLAALAPAVAHGKGGPSEATIEGPGLASPIIFGSSGHGDSSLGLLTAEAGFSAGAFGRPPDPMSVLPERPSGSLGPRYTITYLVPGPNGEEERIRQELYPYATPRPVTYMPPGQSFWGFHGPPAVRTPGGWYVTTSYLKDVLVERGLPENPPATGSGSGFPWTVAGALAALAAGTATGFGTAAFLVRRRRAAMA